MEQEVLPNVYTAAGSATAAMSQGGRFALPQGTVREISDVSSYDTTEVTANLQADL